MKDLVNNTPAFNELSNEVYTRTGLYGGCTINLKGHKPNKGFCLSIFPEKEWRCKFNEFGAEVVRHYIQSNKDLLSMGNIYLGTWFNKEDGLVYIDCSVVTEDQKEAIELCQDNKQLAYYDIAKGEEAYI